MGSLIICLSLMVLVVEPILGESKNSSLDLTIEKDGNKTEDVSTVSLNLDDLKLYLTIQGNPKTNQNFTFTCQGHQVISFEALKCESLSDCHGALNCLRDTLLEECSKMTFGGKSNFEHGEQCPIEKKLGDDNETENCLEIFLDEHPIQKRLSTYVECQVGSRSRGQRHVYYYTHDSDFKVIIHRVDVEEVLKSKSSSPSSSPILPSSSSQSEVEGRKRNYPGDNKIYLTPP